MAANANAYGAEPLGTIPQQRVIAKLDEYMSRRDYAGAERHLRYWLEEAIAARDLRGELVVRNELVGHYRKTGNRENALANARRAVELIDELDFGNTISAGTTFTNAATACNAFGENEESLRLFERASHLYESTPGTDAHLLGGLYNNMALTCVALNRFEQADALYRRALDTMARVENGELEQAITYLNMADAAVARANGGDDDTEAACEETVERYLDRAQELLDTPGIPRDGYYAFVCEKCAPVFAHYGYFLADEDLRERAKAIYERA